MFKKILKVSVILLLVATWLNVGYWGGKSLYSAQIKTLDGEKLNSFEGFQLGPDSWREYLTLSSSKEKAIETSKNATILSIIFWPLFLIISLSFWTVYGIVQAVVGIGHGIVFLWKFFFCGGFFGLLGTVTYHWILIGINLIAGILLALWGRKIQKKRKSKATVGLIFAMVSFASLLFAVIMLTINAEISGWLTFYFISVAYLIFSLIGNLHKR